MKKSALIFVAVCVVAALAYAVYNFVTTKGPEVSAEEYIEAVRERDFAMIFELNHRTQKRMNIIARANEDDRSELVENMYAASETAFNSMALSGDPDLAWAEKFYFIPEMDYRVLQTRKTTTSSTPSSDYRSKRTASVLVNVSYPDPNQAPGYREGRLKEARLRIDLIQSGDVVKGMQTRAVREGWLYQWLKVEDGSAVYWTAE